MGPPETEWERSIVPSSEYGTDTSPGTSYSPFFLALGVALTFCTSIFTPWGVAIGAVPCFLALLAWFWPRGDQGHTVLKEKKS